MSSPLLSVVVPYYNVESYIEACLESLRRQTLTDLEVIMVDDGSRDGSREIAERFAAQDPRFRLVTQANQGLGPARNTGTRHARGRYLTFVDSDDLVAPRAYTWLVGSLEESGSDLATGNAYRFSAEAGVSQSWTHRGLFAVTRRATSLAAFPRLVADRMVWNKVYRRSFWDAGGFEFPAIRYEDYPVTLRAYLEARTVDVVAHHVYFWRDRESGDSITQKRADRDNVSDRATSAAMVLDILEQHRDIHPEVEHRLHSYFAQIDLVAIAEAIVLARPEDRAHIVGDAERIADRLNPAWTDLAPRLARLIHRGLRRRRLDFVQDLARWRLAGDTAQLVRSATRSGGITMVPAVVAAVVNRNRFRNPLRARRLRVAADRMAWTDRGLEFDLAITLRQDLLRIARAEVELVSATGVRVPLAVERTGAKTVRARLDPAALPPADPAGDPFRAPLWVTVHVGPLRWRGRVAFEAEQLPGCARGAHGWVQPRGIGTHLGVAVSPTAVVLGAVEPLPGSRIRLTGAEGSAPGPIRLARPTPPGPLDLGDTATPVEADLADLVADDVIDNLVTQVAFRTFVSPRRRSLEELAALRAAAWEKMTKELDAAVARYGESARHQPIAVPEPKPIEERPVWLAGSEAGIELAPGITCCRDWHGTVGLRREDVLP